VHRFNWRPAGGKHIQVAQNIKSYKKNEERQYECNICLKSFKRSHHLESHKKTHTDEKPFSCAFCCKTFRRKHHLNRHMSTVHRQLINRQVTEYADMNAEKGTSENV
ncbi:unnamed protein product, partial [Owenia fusiformis]